MKRKLAIFRESARYFKSKYLNLSIRWEAGHKAQEEMRTHGRSPGEVETIQSSLVGELQLSEKF